MTEASDWTTTTTPTQQQGTERREDPQAAHSSDLFDGELFGDELIDIYNAAVSEGTAAEGHPRNEGKKHDTPIFLIFYIIKILASRKTLLIGIRFRDPGLASATKCSSCNNSQR